MSKRKLYRASTSRGIESLDEKGEVIRGFSVIQTGEALGHGFEIDAVTLQGVIDHGNASSIGLKSRFGHPNMSNEALGTFLGRAKTFRLSEEGDRVLADLHISKTAHKTPNGDLAQYVISLAIEDPEAFGASIVFEVEAELRLDDKGQPLKDEDGNDLMSLARVKKLFAADVVDEPAANEKGFLGHQFFGADVKLSAEATGFLNNFLEMPDAVQKAKSFLDRYESNSMDEIDRLGIDRVKLPSVSKNLKEEEVEMTRKELSEKFPEIVLEIERDATEAGQKLGAESERARIQSVKDQGQGLLAHADIVGEMMFDGKTTGPEAAVRLLAAEKVNMKAVGDAIKLDASPIIPDQAEVVPLDTSSMSIEDASKAEWNSKPGIRQEFGSYDVFLSYQKADSDGRVKTFKGRV